MKQGHLSFTNLELAANPVAARQKNVWMAFDAKFTSLDGSAKTLTLCDYPSAGNTWDSNSTFRVWLPGYSLNMDEAFSDLTPWKMMSHTNYRPSIPPMANAAR